jgi:hypothetical protein
MNIPRLFSDKKYLAEAFKFFKEKQQIEQIKKNPELVNSYLEK